MVTSRRRTKTSTTEGQIDVVADENTYTSLYTKYALSENIAVESWFDLASFQRLFSVFFRDFFTHLNTDNLNQEHLVTLTFLSFCLQR